MCPDFLFFGKRQGDVSYIHANRGGDSFTVEYSHTAQDFDVPMPDVFITTVYCVQCSRCRK